MNNFNFQGFRFWNDEFEPGFGCFQFQYKGHEVSASNMGVDKGACPKKVAVFDSNDNMIAECDKVEEAINFINSIVN